MEASFNYSGWNSAELACARQTAKEFMHVNQSAIQTSLASQCKILAGLIANLSSAELSFEDRLDCLAHIGEVSQLLRDSAEGFFELGSQPVIAQTLADGRL